MSAQRPLIAFFGHHKAGTMWVCGVLRALCVQLGWRASYHYSPRSFGFDLRRFVEADGVDVLLYVNADMRFVQFGEPHAVFVAKRTDEQCRQPEDRSPNAQAECDRDRRREQGKILQIEHRDRRSADCGEQREHTCAIPAQEKTGDDDRQEEHV